MTAICGGGVSIPNIGTELAVTYGAGRMVQLLAQAGLSEFSPVLPLMGLIPVVLSGFCGTDPPAMVALTSNEAKAVLNVEFGSDFTNGLGKIKDIVLNLIWLDTCHCSTGALVTPTPPATPADAPVFQPPSLAPGPITAGPFYPMRRSEVKVLPLGCGTGTLPAGWHLPTFNDSAWTSGVVPSFATAPWASYAIGFQLGVALGLNPALPGNIDVISPSSPIAHNCEEFVVRWRVFIGNVNTHAVAIRVGSLTQADGGWSSGLAYANGSATSAPGGALNWQTFADRLVPNQWNVIALYVNSGNTSALNTWGTEGGIYLGLDFTSIQNPVNVTPCCPPDVTTQAYLDLILQAVTLTQRQAAPFGYVPGATHAALTGAGQIAISGLLGAAVNLTTIPAHFGRVGTSPTEYFDLGYVTFGTPDGYPTSYRLGKATNLFLPTRCGAYTLLDYDLAPGVVATITELVREP